MITSQNRHLGIDAKTVHRWLADAQVTLQNHPHDGRKKGMSLEHLQVLARLHQRSLPPFLQEPPTPLKIEVPLLPAQVLTLPEQLSALQIQIAALQEHLADLTRRFTQHEPASAHPAAPPTPSWNATHPAKLTPAVSLVRPAVAESPPKPTHVIPRVECSKEGLYVIICPKRGVLPFEPETPEWFAWVAEQDSFRFVGKGGYFTAHHEWRVPQGAWRAHRRIRNRSCTQRLAVSQELTIAVLEQGAQALQSKLI